MVITMAIVVAHWAYKFTTLSSPFIQINRAQLFVPSLRSQRITSHSILSTTLSDHRSSLESISSAAVKNPSVASTPRDLENAVAPSVNTVWNDLTMADLVWSWLRARSWVVPLRGEVLFPYLLVSYFMWRP
ncbi:uncharacterized protein [Zea mays]|uniref:uncharacterized protein n=1 Tax=Zea mays TaxID=4577 RepID=UPI0004DE7DE9|nr:uncharacterized protein LOC103635612 [Zea mays]|eukprot:XP_008656245.1 uncharacterized protein LOC103635612 [Zea mays]